MTTGQQIRDFIPVYKVAGAFVADMVSAPPKSPNIHVKNVCLGKGVSILAFAQCCWSEWNAKGRLLPGCIPSRTNEPVRFVGLPFQ